MGRCFSTAFPIIRFPCRLETWRNFSMFEVSVEHTFAAGHALRNYHGKCENVHGHNYRVRVLVRGEKLDETGMLADFVELKRLLRAVSEPMDHVFLNEMPPFDELNPSAENIAVYICEKM